MFNIYHNKKCEAKLKRVQWQVLQLVFARLHDTASILLVQK